jgi:adenosylcobinamide kinase/adenosylcobinamide-phosphate guanylyltransferase
LGSLTLYLGGAKSGKTKAALKAASSFKPPRYYLATAQGLDQEMLQRIKNHQAERGPDWKTIEAPLDPAGAISKLQGNNLVIMDCLTLWLSNLLTENQDHSDLSFVTREINKLISVINDYPGPVFIVSNEVGWGLVPMNPVGRAFRDMSGLAHQLLAEKAQEVWLIIAGLPLKLK